MTSSPDAPMSDLHTAARDRYDVRCHKLISFTPVSTEMEPKRKDLPLPSALGMQLSPLLAQRECDALLAAAESWGFEDIAWEYDKAYRDCTRVVTMAPSLADVLWQRVLTALKPSDLATADDPTGGVRPVGFGCEGVWRPVGVNPCVRFSRYVGGGHFQPHRDSAFVITDDKRSVLTIMAYLTEGFEGGETTFYAENRGAPSASPCPGELLHTIVPARGDGLVFSHAAWHAGEEVTRGAKMILRTDIIFERAPCYQLARHLSDPTAAQPTSALAAHLASTYASHPGYIEAERLFEESIALQTAGDPKGSTAAFIRALELHATLPAAAPAAPAMPTAALFFSRASGAPLGEAVLGEAEAGTLPENVLALILEQLGPEGVCLAATLSKAWRAAAASSECWLDFYRASFGDDAVKREAEATALRPPAAPAATPSSHRRQVDDWRDMHEAPSAPSAEQRATLKALVPPPPISKAAQRALLLSRDWKAAYRGALEARRAKRVLVVDLGFHNTKFSLSNEELVDGLQRLRREVDAQPEGWQRSYRREELTRRTSRAVRAMRGDPHLMGPETATAAGGAAPTQGAAASSEQAGAELDPLSGSLIRKPGCLPSLVARVAGHHWGAGSGISQFMCGVECLEYRGTGSGKAGRWGALFDGQVSQPRRRIWSPSSRRIWSLKPDRAAGSSTRVRRRCFSHGSCAMPSPPRSPRTCPLCSSRCRRR